MRFCHRISQYPRWIRSPWYPGLLFLQSDGTNLIAEYALEFSFQLENMIENKLIIVIYGECFHFAAVLARSLTFPYDSLGRPYLRVLEFSPFAGILPHMVPLVRTQSQLRGKGVPSDLP